MAFCRSLFLEIWERSHYVTQFVCMEILLPLILSVPFLTSHLHDLT